MSLSRTALRLAVVAALDADPVIASLCPNRVFDSLIDELDTKDPVPVIVVYTEDDGGKAWSVNNGGAPFDHACHLVLEISMRATATVGSEIVIGIAGTDSEMEATLDLIEGLAVDVVTIGDSPQSLLIRKAVTRRATELTSVRYASADTGAKIAMRIATLTTHLKVDQPDVLNPPTGPFAALPDPLRTVAAALDPASPGYATCQALATKLTPPTAPAAAGPLELDVTDAIRSQFEPANPPQANDPTAPDPLFQSIATS